MKTLDDLRQATMKRLGDAEGVIWTSDEVDLHIKNGYQAIGNTQSAFFDVLYAENLPAGFSMNYAWERRYLSTSPANFDFGVANFTYEEERFMSGDELHAVGPAKYTSPFELLEGHFDAAACDPAIPATAELPESLAALDRVVYDKRGIDEMEARRMSKVDARYEITAGEVYGYIWQKDGIRTLRKVRVPAQRAGVYNFRGAWGTLRDITDIWSGAISGFNEPGFDQLGFDNIGFFTLDTDAALWGIPRRIPGHHPMGTSRFGIPRRFFQETTNVRVEHFRQGRPMNVATDVCELPDLYARYLQDYAQGKCLERPGPGQDEKLAKHFLDRWARGLARIARRVQLTDTEHVMVMGGSGQPSVMRPPRPKLPWPYGSTVRW